MAGLVYFPTTLAPGLPVIMVRKLALPQNDINHLLSTPAIPKGGNIISNYGN